MRAPRIRLPNDGQGVDGRAARPGIGQLADDERDVLLLPEPGRAVQGVVHDVRGIVPEEAAQLADDARLRPHHPQDLGGLHPLDLGPPPLGRDRFEVFAHDLPVRLEAEDLPDLGAELRVGQRVVDARRTGPPRPPRAGSPWTWPGARRTSPTGPRGARAVILSFRTRSNTFMAYRMELRSRLWIVSKTRRAESTSTFAATTFSPSSHFRARSLRTTPT